MRATRRAFAHPSPGAQAARNPCRSTPRPPATHAARRPCRPQSTPSSPRPTPPSHDRLQCIVRRLSAVAVFSGKRGTAIQSGPRFHQEASSNAPFSLSEQAPRSARMLNVALFEDFAGTCTAHAKLRQKICGKPKATGTVIQFLTFCMQSRDSVCCLRLQNPRKALHSSPHAPPESNRRLGRVFEPRSDHGYAKSRSE